MNKRILVDLGINSDYITLLESIFSNEKIEIISIDKFSFNEKYDLLLLTGGSDVNPNLYGESKGKYTSIDINRDAKEIHIIEELLYSKLPKLGICRGSQLLCALNGGKVIQHVENHTSPHVITLSANGLRNKEIKVTSTHHQMMYPFNLNPNDYDLLGWSTYYRSNVYLNGNNDQIDIPTNFLEPEIIYFDKTKSLAIQSHPEFPSFDPTSKSVIIKLIKSYLNV